MTLIDPDLFHALRGACSTEQALVFDTILFQHTVTRFMEQTADSISQLRLGQQMAAATYQDVINTLTRMNDALTAIMSEDDAQDALIAQQNALITQLQTQVANASPLTQAQLDEIVGLFTAAGDRATAISQKAAAAVVPTPA